MVSTRQQIWSDSLRTSAYRKSRWSCLRKIHRIQNWRKFVQFPSVYMCTLFVILKIKLSQELSWYIFLTLPHVLIKKSFMFTWVHTRRTTGPNSWLPQTVPEFVCSLLNSDYYSYIFNLICNTATGRPSLFFRCMGVIVILINRWYSVINLI